MSWQYFAVCFLAWYLFTGVIIFIAAQFTRSRASIVIVLFVVFFWPALALMKRKD